MPDIAVNFTSGELFELSGLLYADLQKSSEAIDGMKNMSCIPRSTVDLIAKSFDKRAELLKKLYAAQET